MCQTPSSPPCSGALCSGRQDAALGSAGGKCRGAVIALQRLPRADLPVWLTLQIPFGCSVINANISELRDMPGEDNKYFESLKAKAITATQEARYDRSSAHRPVLGGPLLVVYTRVACPATACSFVR